MAFSRAKIFARPKKAPALPANLHFWCLQLSTVSETIALSKKSNNSEGQIQSTVFLMQEVTLHFLVDAIVIYVLNDVKVKRTLTRQTNKRHLVR